MKIGQAKISTVLKSCIFSFAFISILYFFSRLRLRIYKCQNYLSVKFDEKNLFKNGLVTIRPCSKRKSLR